MTDETGVGVRRGILNNAFGFFREHGTEPLHGRIPMQATVPKERGYPFKLRQAGECDDDDAAGASCEEPCVRRRNRHNGIRHNDVVQAARVKWQVDGGGIFQIVDRCVALTVDRKINGRRKPQYFVLLNVFERQCFLLFKALEERMILSDGDGVGRPHQRHGVKIAARHDLVGAEQEKIELSGGEI